MYSLLTSQYAGFRCPGPFHRRHLPHACAAYFRFTIVRNPFSRAVSIWYSTTQRDDDRYGVRASLGERADRFVEFSTWLLARHRRPVFQPIHQWIGRLRFDYVMRLERLVDDVNRLPFVTRRLRELPCENPTNHVRGPWQAYYTGQAVDNIRTWANADFELYGYDRDPL